MNEEYKPLLAITMGDAAGSGPEIITKALAQPEIKAACLSVVIGDAATMRAALEITGVPGEVRAIKKLSEASFPDGVIEVIDLHNIQLDQLKRGQVKKIFYVTRAATRHKEVINKIDFP